MSIILKTNSKC